MLRISKLIFTFVLTLCSISAFAANVNWHSFSRSSFETAKNEHRMVLVFGMATWCPWCRRMKTEVFTDRTVVSLINKYYIPVMVDIDREADTASKYQMTGVPINIILDSNYRVIDTKMGFVGADEMASFLRNNANS